MHACDAARRRRSHERPAYLAGAACVRYAATVRNQQRTTVLGWVLHKVGVARGEAKNQKDNASRNEILGYQGPTKSDALRGGDV